ncbi:cytochrome b [Vibrio sinensis]|uniref:Cytochrome b n=1 Tax=Vibrio sinensis TaxID=2302434 RepID=A0A3A6QVJ9_9VIBR|nr:cytochrome b [Vibrio sinensis]RJX75318.1 cytochrome b [Vibrio sinensis]
MLNPLPLSRSTIFWHWLTALSFIAIFALGYYLVDLPRSPEKGELIGIHKSFGALFLLLAIARIIWRLKEGAISPASETPAWQEKAAKSVHGLLMLATLVMPISGIAMSIGGGRSIDIFGWTLISAGEKVEWLQQVGGNIHGFFVNIIIAVFALHILGAIKHHVLDKDQTLNRMFGR